MSHPAVLVAVVVAEADSVAAVAGVDLVADGIAIAVLAEALGKMIFLCGHRSPQMFIENPLGTKVLKGFSLFRHLQRKICE